MGAEIFHVLKKQLSAAGHNTSLGDEGGFAPGLKSADEALGFIAKACETAGYRPGEDVMFALDCAATEFFADGTYNLDGEGKRLDAAGMVDYLADLAARYPIASIEDGCAEDDWDGWGTADRASGQGWCNWSGMICSSPIRSGCARGSTGISPIRSWSR